MNWEWVALILGTVLLIVLLMGWVAWLQMIQTKARLGYARTYQNIPWEKEEDVD